jgi:chromate reductase
MTTILGISGSLRSGSFNTQLLAAAVQLTEAGTTLDVASIRDIPLYDVDVEAARGIPQAVRAWKARVIASDGLLVATPEYNTGISGVFKNTIDRRAEIGAAFGGRLRLDQRTMHRALD